MAEFKPEDVVRDVEELLRGAKTGLYTDDILAEAQAVLNQPKPKAAPEPDPVDPALAQRIMDMYAQIMNDEVKLAMDKLALSSLTDQYEAARERIEMDKARAVKEADRIVQKGRDLSPYGETPEEAADEIAALKGRIAAGEKKPPAFEAMEKALTEIRASAASMMQATTKKPKPPAAAKKNAKPGQNPRP